ncbi:MAG: IPT/TIG domain-containing protein [Chloroflexi bacterium]|nr:IPT/TIG domain-containing protein [Chloroflexota bacterium]
MARTWFARIGRGAAGWRPWALGAAAALVAGLGVFGMADTALAQQAGEQGSSSSLGTPQAGERRSNAPFGDPTLPTDAPPREFSGRVVSADGRGVERATIAVQRYTPSDGAPPEAAKGALAGTAASSLDGRFGVSLPPGEWELSVTTPDGRVGRARLALGLAAEDPRPELVIGVAPPPPPTASERTVQTHDTRPCPTTTYTVTGTVRSAWGVALSGQYVYADWPGGTRWCSNEVTSTSTASDGSYQLTLGPGLWRVSTWIWGASLGTEAARTANVSGNLTGVDLAGPAEPTSLANLSGTLQLPSGAGAGGYSVWASGEDNRWETHSVNTAADGSFTLLVPPGRWWLYAWYPNGNDGSLASSYRLPSLQVAVGSGGVSGAVARMQAGAAFRLRLRTPSGAPAANRYVSVDESLSSGTGSQYLSSWYSNSFTIGVDGTTSYTCCYSAAGLYRVSVSSLSGSSSTLGMLGLETFVNVPVGVSTIDVAVPDEAGGPTIGGAVRSSTGAGVSDAFVWSEGYHPSYGFLWAGATAGSDGTFRLPAVPGVWWASAYSSGYLGAWGRYVDVSSSGVSGVSLTLRTATTVAPDVYEPDDSPAQARPLTLDGSTQQHSLSAGDNDWVSFALAAGNQVRLSTDDSDCDTYLYLYAPDGSTILAQDDDSGSGLASLLEYTVASSGTYFGRVRHFNATSGTCASYGLGGSLVTAPVLVHLRGYVRDAAGSAVEGTEVGVWDQVAGRRVATWSAADGWYDLAVLPAPSGATWTVNAGTPPSIRHLKGAWVWLVPGADGGAAFNFALPFKSSFSRLISGTVRWPDGTPAHNRWVDAYVGTSITVGVQQFQDIGTNSSYDGSFSLAVPARTWCIWTGGEYRREFGGVGDCGLDTNTGNVSGLSLSLAAPAATLAGTVTDSPTGLALPGADVSYRSDSGSLWLTTYSRPDGGYHLYAFSTSTSGWFSVSSGGFLGRYDTGVALPAGTTARNVALRRATRTLSGSVASGGTPQPGVWVRATIDEGGITSWAGAYTDGQGIFGLGVWPGTWSLQADVPCPPPARSITVSGDVADVAIDLGGCVTPTPTPAATATATATPITPTATPTPITPTATPTPSGTPATLSLQPAEAAVAPSGTVTVALQASLPSGRNLGAWTVDVTYDPAVVQAIACTTPTSGGLFACNEAYAANTARVVGVASPGLAGTQTLASLTFRAVGGSGSSSTLTLVIQDFTDDGNLALPVSATNGLIRVGVPPTVTAISPTRGSVRGGTSVTLTGANFQGGATAAFRHSTGSLPASNVAVGGATSLTATAPRSPEHYASGQLRLIGDVNGNGSVTAVDALCVLRRVAALLATTACPADKLTTAVDVVVTNPDSQSGALAGGYTYLNADVNGSGTVTAVDALCVLRQVASLPATSSCPAPPASPTPILSPAAPAPYSGGDAGMAGAPELPSETSDAAGAATWAGTAFGLAGLAVAGVRRRSG